MTHDIVHFEFIMQAGVAATAPTMIVEAHKIAQRYYGDDDYKLTVTVTIHNKQYVGHAVAEKWFDRKTGAGDDVQP